MASLHGAQSTFVGWLSVHIYHTKGLRRYLLPSFMTMICLDWYQRSVQPPCIMRLFCINFPAILLRYPYPSYVRETPPLTRLPYFPHHSSSRTLKGNIVGQRSSCFRGDTVHGRRCRSSLWRRSTGFRKAVRFLASVRR